MFSSAYQRTTVNLLACRANRYLTRWKRLKESLLYLHVSVLLQWDAENPDVCLCGFLMSCIYILKNILNFSHSFFFFLRQHRWKTGQFYITTNHSSKAKEVSPKRREWQNTLTELRHTAWPESLSHLWHILLHVSYDTSVILHRYVLPAGNSHMLARWSPTRQKLSTSQLSQVSRLTVGHVNGSITASNSVTKFSFKQSRWWLTDTSLSLWGYHRCMHSLLRPADPS